MGHRDVRGSASYIVVRGREENGVQHCGERTGDRSRTGYSSMDSWIAVRGRGSTGFSTMDRGQGAGEVLRVQHHG